jgi:hypothetical protein
LEESKMTAAAIAKKRLENYLNDKLADAWDSEAWEFYTFLLGKAQNHPVDCSGFESKEYQQDAEKAKGA